MAIVADAIQWLFKNVSANTASICRDAAGVTVDSWWNWQNAKAASLGAGAASIPIAGYLTMPAELPMVMRLMHRAANGICAIRLGHADDDTFAGVLAVWTGDVELTQDTYEQMVAAATAKAAVGVGGQLGVKMAVKAFAVSSGIIVGQALHSKVAAKVAAKMAAKMTAKAGSRWIPVISAVVGGGANYWIVNGVSKAADDYCTFILSHSKTS